MVSITVFKISVFLLQAVDIWIFVGLFFVVAALVVGVSIDVILSKEEENPRVGSLLQPIGFAGQRALHFPLDIWSLTLLNGLHT